MNNVEQIICSIQKERIWKCFWICSFCTCKTNEMCKSDKKKNAKFVQLYKSTENRAECIDKGKNTVYIMCKGTEVGQK